jgi:predicted component of type VI protein secretion system
MIPFKYFAYSFNGVPHYRLDALLDSLKLTKSSTFYSNSNNTLTSLINEGKYLMNQYNPYRNKFIDKYKSADKKFKLLSITGIKERSPDDINELSSEMIPSISNDELNDPIAELVNSILVRQKELVSDIEKLRSMLPKKSLNLIEMIEDSKSKSSNSSN